MPASGINLLREWAMKHPYAPEPVQVIVVAPDTWRVLQRQMTTFKPDETPLDILHRQRFDGIPIVVDGRVPPGSFDALTVEEFHRRYPAPSSSGGTPTTPNGD